MGIKIDGIKIDGIFEISGVLKTNNQEANTRISNMAAEVVILSIYKFITPKNQIYSGDVLKKIPLKDGSINDFDLAQIINNVVEEIDDYYKWNYIDYNCVDIDDETADKIKTVEDVANEAYKMLEPTLHLDKN